MTIAQSLDQFYKNNNFKPDGGENDSFFEIKFKHFSLKLPNFSFRKKVIYIHDIQHILYEQNTSWKGEAFIAGWEIGTKMWKHFPIGILSLWAMGFSLLNYPEQVLKGYTIGLKNKGILDINLEKEVVLNKTLDDLKRLIKKKNPKPFSKLTYLFWRFVSLLIFLFPLLFILSTLILFI
jgi:hypothetical protein